EGDDALEPPYDGPRQQKAGGDDAHAVQEGEIEDREIADAPSRGGRRHRRLHAAAWQNGGRCQLDQDREDESEECEPEERSAKAVHGEVVPQRAVYASLIMARRVDRAPNDDRLWVSVIKFDGLGPSSFQLRKDVVRDADSSWR